MRTDELESFLHYYRNIMLNRHIKENCNDSIATDYLGMLNENYSILELLRQRLAAGEPSVYNFNHQVVNTLYGNTMDDLFSFQSEWNLSFRLWYDGFKASKVNREEVLRDGLDSVQLAYQNSYPSITKIMVHSLNISVNINYKIDLIDKYFSTSKFNLIERRSILKRIFYAVKS